MTLALGRSDYPSAARGSRTVTGLGTLPLRRIARYTVVTALFASVIGFVREGSVGGGVALGVAAGVGAAVGLLGFEIVQGYR